MADLPVLSYCLTLEEFIQSLADMIDFIDLDTRDHSRKSRLICMKIAEQLGLPTEEIALVGYGANIHDIGKFAIDPDVMRQPTRLTVSQYQMVQQHPLYGLQMLRHTHLPQEILDCVHYHHEHWDGSGYPEQLKGEAIPLAARIVCCGEVWESLNSDRPYRKALARNDAIVFMGRRNSTWFDPAVYKAFIDLIKADKL